jgi:glycosyltransferase involved in cell wall biosynthesis
MKLSLVITNYNRTALLHESFRNVLNDDRIDEIVIVDDHSDYFTRNWIEDKFKNYSKVNIYLNPVNIGQQRIKGNAVGRAKNEWVILFDSDNIIKSDYIDALFKHVPKFQDNCIYMPQAANPQFDFRKFAGLYYHKQQVAQNITDGMFNICMNTANYVVNRDFFLKTFKRNEDMKGADVVWHSIQHMEAGGIFFIVPEMEYYHRVHKGSGFMKDMDYNMKKAAELREIIKAYR